ncbi:phage regulatory protein/antirepressor Ant [Escherichia coli]|nr:phage regulatory protein/antirepressor Ant [Escherichia coli]
MNELINGNAIKMTSIEIAELVESRHSNVKVSIDRLVKRGVIKPPALQHTNIINDLDVITGKRDFYVFEGEQGKRDSIVVVAQLSPEFTARLVDRWQELENNGGMIVPRSLPEALRLAADLAEQKQRLSEELAVAAPKAEFVDRYVMATGSMTFRQVAKLLNAKEPEFAMFLIENGIMYRLNRVLTPKSKHIEAGRFEVKTGTTNQTNYAFNQSRFTAKGVRWIGGLWAEHIAKGQIA